MSITNSPKATNTSLWSVLSFPWQLALPWQVTGEGMTNVTKVNNADLWSTITSTWGSEPRTWLECVSTMDNTTKVTPTITNTAKPS